jgi:surface protein
MEERPLPVAKRQKTTQQDEGTTITALTRGAAAVAMNDSPTSIIDLLRSLPANIVANYIYPFAVKIIQNREELIAAVDEYLDEFYTDDDGDYDDADGDEEAWLDEEGEEDGEDTSSDDDEEVDEQDGSSAWSDNRILLGPNHPNGIIEPRRSNEPQDDGTETTAAPVPLRRAIYPIGDWDVSRMNDFTSLFDEERNHKARHFSADLSRWNVTNGTSFAQMFRGCHVFQSDLSNWDTGRATDLSEMFNGCTSFQSDLSRWNVANAIDLNGMFAACTSFNSDLSDWNVANATDLSSMFYGCTSFNSDISRWNVANATNFIRMFRGCTSFNSDVSQWDVANAIWALNGMFRGCDSFDRHFVATWPLPDEESVERLFDDSV